MFLRLFMHFIFGIIPLLTIPLWISPSADGFDWFFLITIMSLLGIWTSFLAMPVINIIFRMQYKKFLINYKYRKELSQYSDTSSFYRSVYDFMQDFAGLDSWNEYYSKLTYHNMQADCLIPLIRMNSNISLLNKMEFKELKNNSFNMLPNSFMRGVASKELYAETKEKYQPKPQPKIEIKEQPRKVVDHLNQDLMDK